MKKYGVFVYPPFAKKMEKTFESWAERNAASVAVAYSNYKALAYVRAFAFSFFNPNVEVLVLKR